jgi:hypothetical protein
MGWCDAAACLPPVDGEGRATQGDAEQAKGSRVNAFPAAPRELDFGALLSLTFANLRLVWWQVLSYLAVVAVLAFAVPLAGDGPTGLLGLGLYLGGQYWLYHSLLKARGLLETSRIHALGFVGLAAVLFFPIMFGLALFVLPGLFLVARWIAAPAFIVARGEGVFPAARLSWQAVRGNTGKLAAAVALLFVLVSVIGGLSGGVDVTLSDLGVDRRAQPIDLIQAQLFPVLLFALSCATYDLLGPRDNSIEEVFG